MCPANVVLCVQMSLSLHPAYDCTDLFGDPSCADYVSSMLEWLDFDMHQDRLQLRHLRRAFNRRRIYDNNRLDQLLAPPPLRRQVATDFREGLSDPSREHGTRDHPIDLTA